jgi:hypothetical protein
LKTIMSIKWAADHCSNAHYLLKIDDDIMINVYHLSKYLQHLLDSNIHTNNTFLGICWGDRPIDRHDSKFYMPLEEFPFDSYPIYCSGAAYLVTSDLASPLYEMSLRVPKLRFEDVFLGILGGLLNSSFVDITNHFNIYKDSSIYSNVIENIENTFFIIFNQENNYLFGWKEMLIKLYGETFIEIPF